MQGRESNKEEQTQRNCFPSLFFSFLPTGTAPVSPDFLPPRVVMTLELMTARSPHHSILPSECTLFSSEQYGTFKSPGKKEPQDLNFLPPIISHDEGSMRRLPLRTLLLTEYIVYFLIWPKLGVQLSCIKPVIFPSSVRSSPCLSADSGYRTREEGPT